MKHRREVLFASLPIMFALHQFTEGFVWLGIDGMASPAVEHRAGAAFMLYAQGLLPVLIPLSVMLFERTAKRRRVMLPFVILGGGLTLYTLWALAAFQTQVVVRFRESGHDLFRNCEPGDPADCDGGETLCVHVCLVRVCRLASLIILAYF